MGKQTKKPYSGKSGAGIWEDEPVGDGSIPNDRKGVSAPSQRVEQPGIQHGSVCVLDEMKLGREVKSRQRWLIEEETRFNPIK